jgi:acetyl esterase/lipase
VPPNLPPLLIQVGSDEVLLDDSRRYANGVDEAGGAVRLEIWQGMHHVFQLNVAELASARKAIEAAGRFLATHLTGASKIDAH